MMHIQLTKALFEIEDLKQQNAALRAAIDKALARLDYCAGLGTQADFDATFQVMCELRSALTPAAPDETSGALAAIGMFDAALRAAKAGGQ